jgi:PAS domain S-box-containing protein
MRRGNMKAGHKIKKELTHELRDWRRVGEAQRDVLEQNRPGEARLESGDKFRDLAEKSLAGIYLIQDGVFKYGNSRFAEIFGYRVEDVIDKMGPQDMVLPEDWPTVDENIRKRIKGNADSIHYEFKGITKDKETINIEVYGSRIMYQGRPAVMGTLLDITKRKRAEDDLRRLNEFNRALIDNAPIGICTLNKNGVFTSVNVAFASLLGLEPRGEEKLIGFNWLKNSHTIKFGLAGYIERGLQGESFQLRDFPYTNYRGDRNFYMDFKGVPLKGKGGIIEGLLCIIEETTDRVTTRAKLLQEAKVSATGRLAAGIAHELNNPLATLVAHSELACHCLESLQEGIGKQLELEELRTYLKIIEVQAFRCKHVTGDILNLPWKEGWEVSDIDINRLLSDILEFINMHKPNERIVKEMFTPLPPVRADISALRQVFVNLINNAVDALEGRTDATIWIRTKLNNNKVLVAVEDNGPGIADSIANKIFEPFFTTKDSKKGAGLGLSLCKEFLGQIGGTIKAESKPGCGATFLVTLPTGLKEEEELRLR